MTAIEVTDVPILDKDEFRELLAEHGINLEAAGDGPLERTRKTRMRSRFVDGNVFLLDPRASGMLYRYPGTTTGH